LFVQLPRWKCYLYTLIQRKRLYNAINSQQYRWGFKRHEIYLLRKMCFKYLEKGGQKLLKADRYDQLIDQVLGNRMVIADVEEIELANQLLIIKKINIGRLLMELKELKEFGKEVGLKLAQMNKMSDDSLVLEVIRNVEPKIQYSKELVAWYNELDDSLFDQAEAESGASTETAVASGDAGISIDDVVEVIEGYTKKAELLEIIEDNDVAPLFIGFDASAYKLPTQLKKAMVDFLTAPPPTEVNTESAGDDQLTEAVELINECENEDQLVEVYSEYQGIFGDMEVPDDVDVEVLQTMMLDHIKSKTESKEEKPMSLRDRIAAKKAAAGSGKTETKDKTEKKPSNEELFNWWEPDSDGFNVDDAFAEVEKLKMTDLRKFAKFIGLTIGIGKKKDEILDLVASKISETVEGVNGSTDQDNVQVTAELINDAAKGKDRDSLVEMCDLLKIKLNALQKKSVPGMQKKLLAAIESKDTTEETTTVKTRSKLSAKVSTTDAQSVYGVMEQLVVAGKSEDVVLKAVSPIYREKGKSIIFIKKRVHTMFEIIKTDNDMD
jgi:hypothetical protein